MDEAIAVPDISTLTSDKVQKCQAQIRFVIHTNTIFRCGQTDLKAGPREKVVARLASYRAELARQEEQVSSVAVRCSAERCSVVQCRCVSARPRRARGMTAWSCSP